jgi:cytochrome c oxidase subunit 2
MLTSRSKLLAAVIGIAFPWSLMAPAMAAYDLNLPPPVSPIGEEILNLHNLIMLICLIIFVVVFSFMFYSIYAHRKSKGHKPAQFSHSTKLEIVWSVIPFLILVGMAIPSTATLIRMEDTSKADLTVKITGYQWKWRYEYMGHDVVFNSNMSTPRDQIENRSEKGENYLLEVDRPLVLPTDTKIRFLITADDVIHSWWVPELAVKKDAIPGFINEFWTLIQKPGIYRGQCTELCGKDHGFMPVVVDARSPEEFQAWLASNRKDMAAETQAAMAEWSMDDLMSKGKEVYAACAACHGPKGEGVPNVFPPIAGSTVATGPVDQHLELVMNGKAGTAMQAFKGQLSDTEIAAVVTYQRNAFGNSTGDAVQPADVKALR